MTPENIAKTAALTAAGQPLRAIAEKLGTSVTSVHRAKQSAKDIIEAIRDDLINHTARQSADNIKHAITAYRNKDSDSQLREHGYKASTRMLETIGIYPSHTPSVLIQQIINDTTNVAATPESLSLLARAMGLKQVESVADQVTDCQTVDNPVDNSTKLIGKP
jgi:hypothetical protein